MYFGSENWRLGAISAIGCDKIMSDDEDGKSAASGPQDIESLIALAEDRSEAARKTLVDNISDLFLADEGRLNDHERALMLDIIAKLLGSIEAEIRRQLSDRLADADWAPADLVVMLANDDIEIARPILEASTVLQDEDLIEIVRSRAREHRLAIALSRSLSEDVSDAIVDAGGEEDDVLEALIRNPNAELSRAAMDYLVAESERRDGFQEPLLRRADMPPDLAHKMFWWVGAALREFVLNDYDLSAHVIEPAIEGATAAGLARHGTAGNAGMRESAGRLAGVMDESGNLNVPVLLRLLEQGRIQAFMAGLAQLSGVSFDTVDRIVLDQGGEALALICRMIGTDRSQFTRISLLIKKIAVHPPMRVEEVEHIATLFDEVDEERAAIAMYYWQQDSPLQNAVDKLKRRKESL